MRTLLIALSFLTIVPVRFRRPPSEAEIARSRRGYPAIGLLIGLLIPLFAVMALTVTPVGIATFLTLAAWVFISGGLHLDGLADTCDGLFGGRSPEHRLRIMADSHIGAFGTIGIVLILLGKYTGLQYLMEQQDSRWALFCLGGSIFAARCLILVAAGMGRYVRRSGTGKLVIDASSKLQAVAVLIGLGLVGAGPGMLFLAIGILSTLGIVYLCRIRLNGITGDCLGAVVEVSETVMIAGAGIQLAGMP